MDEKKKQRMFWYTIIGISCLGCVFITAAITTMTHNGIAWAPFLALPGGAGTGFLAVATAAHMWDQ